MTNIALRAKALSLALVILLVIALGGFADRASRGYLDDASGRAFSAFVLGKSLNALISVTQKIQFSVGGAITSSPGEALDPIDDLVERFSNVVLFAWVSLKIQGVLMEICGHPLATLAILITGGLALAALWRGSGGRLWLKSALILLTLKLWVPLASGSSTLVHHLFLEGMYDEAAALTANAASAMPAASSAPEDAGQGGLGKWFGDLFKGGAVYLADLTPDFMKRVPELLLLGAKEAVSIPRMESFTSSPHGTLEALMSLIVVFVFETMLLPLFWLYALTVAIGWLARCPASKFDCGAAPPA